MGFLRGADRPFALHGLSLRDRARWCAGHFAGVLGFSIGAAVCIAVPVLGLLVLPCGVAGATRLPQKPARSRGERPLQPYRADPPRPADDA